MEEEENLSGVQGTTNAKQPEALKKNRQDIELFIN